MILTHFSNMVAGVLVQKKSESYSFDSIIGAIPEEDLPDTWCACGERPESADQSEELRMGLKGKIEGGE